MPKILHDREDDHLHENQKDPSWVPYILVLAVVLALAGAVMFFKAVI